MAGEIVGFYDGSTSKDGKRITLAGYAAKPEVWREVKDDSPVGIQAADFLAWHTNRDWWKRDGGEKDLLLRFRMIAAGLLTAHRYDYEKLMDRYKDRPARGPDGRVLSPPLRA